MRRDTALFADNGMNEMVFNKMRQMRADIDACPTQALLSTDLEELCQQFMTKYRLTALTLYPEKTTTSQAEAQIDVRYLPNAFLFDRDSPSHVPGTRFTFHVPFDGDNDLFRYRPSTYWSVFPHGRVAGSKVLLDYDRNQPDVTELRSQFDKDVDLVKRYIDSQRQDVERFNQEMERDVRKHIQTRRDRLLQNQQIGNAMGFPQEPR